MRRDPLISTATSTASTEPGDEGESPAEKNRRLNILHVEDNVEEVTLTRHLLSRSDDIQYDVKNASGLNVAAQHLSHISYDAMLLDLNLGDGEGVYTLLWAAPFMSKLPVIVLSGSDNERLRDAALNVGAQDYLVKGSFSRESLSQAIINAIENHQRAEEGRLSTATEDESQREALP